MGVVDEFLEGLVVWFVEFCLLIFLRWKDLTGMFGILVYMSM